MLIIDQKAAASRATVKRAPPKWLIVAAFLFAEPSIGVISTRVLGQQPATEKPSEARQTGAISADERKLILKRLEAEVQELKQQADNLHGLERQLRGEVRDKCGLSPENVMPIMLSLERDRFTLEIEVKLKSARKKDLADAIAKETKVARQRGGDDEVADHLKQIVEVRKAAVAALEAAHKVQGVSDSEVKSAQADLAEAQIRVALRKEELGKSHSEAVVDQLNRQLLDVSMAVTQDQLRLELLSERLTSLAETGRSLDEYKRVTESELPRVLRLLDQAEARLAEVKATSAQ